LVAEAVACAFGAGRRGRTEAILNSGHKTAINTLVDAYLGESHRDDRPQGCAVAALAADVVRSTRTYPHRLYAAGATLLGLDPAALKRGDLRLADNSLC